MKEKGNTVLITGGGSGIGYETAKIFAEKGNRVIISGRNEEKLNAAAQRLKNATAIICDITNEEDVDRLVQRLYDEFGSLNVLINNAGVAHHYLISEHSDTAEKAGEEMLTNYFSNIRLTEKLLPLLRRQPEAAFVNITSIAAYTPGAAVPTYSASKAALHSYTQSLRLTLQRSTRIQVFEVLPPLVETEFSKQLTGDKMQPSEVAKDIFDGFSNDVFEIRPGFTEVFYRMFLQSPEKAFNSMNRVER
ncbi:MAG: SDR family NAD(P)-dependent oxidoreductase [Haliscomenobacteraceae bacterium CHB4]|nr:putative oxidoreductase [Saprospiraceae bacterium]MCE7924817.1 SDR family NAD(P)-dependent oxidoreductase [Haliscomenobacteraceae bacterium CHB4]